MAWLAAWRAFEVEGRGGASEVAAYWDQSAHGSAGIRPLGAAVPSAILVGVSLLLINDLAGIAVAVLVPVAAILVVRLTQGRSSARG